MDKQTPVTLIVLNLMAFLVVLGVFWLGYQELGAEQSTRLKLAQLQQQIKQADEGETLLDQVASNRSKVVAYFIDSRAWPRLIDSLQQTASSTGVVLELTEANEIVEASQTKLSLSLSVSGSFAQVTNYLGLLEAMPYEMVFNEVSLSQAVADGSEKLWHLQTNLEIWAYQHE